MPWPLKFGAFIPPLTAPPNKNPTRRLMDTLEMIEHMDRLGFDEVWVGEHRTGGYEIVGSPEVFLAAAIGRTRHIRLGTGVISLPYHNPYNVADRVVLLDHLSQGRIMMGVGPGVLAGDAHMIGIEPTRQREMMAESLGVILKLFAGERVTHESDWFTLRDAKLQLRPYQFPHPEIALAALFTPGGPTLAAKHGAGLLSLGAATEQGFKVLDDHWQIMEDVSREHGRVPDRRAWRHTVALHLADTEEQARRDVEYGLRHVNQYLTHSLPGVEDGLHWSHDELVDRSIEGGMLIGTPEMAIEKIQQLWDKSGGFGTFLVAHYELADRAAQRKSFELLADQVVPRFNLQGAAPADSFGWMQEHGAELAVGTVRALKAAGASSTTSALNLSR
jgi:limonene 1,2-monooxygenase